MANLVMYFGIIVEVRVALGATLVFTTIYTNVEDNGHTNDIHAIRTIKTHLSHYVNFICTYISVKIVF